jgi:multicomponent Na+:H+ antiporter subunit E
MIWLALAGPSSSDMPAGAFAVAAATFVSLRLIPAGRPLSPLGLVRFSLRFFVQSLRAGVDVARRAFDPALPLAPGTITHHTRWPVGIRRAALAASLSLQPGTLPSGTLGERGLLIHCLDTHLPVVDQIAADEAAFRHMLGDRDRDA